MEKLVKQYPCFRESVRRGKDLATQMASEKVASTVATFLPDDSGAMILKNQSYKRHEKR